MNDLIGYAKSVRQPGKAKSRGPIAQIEVGRGVDCIHPPPKSQSDFGCQWEGVRNNDSSAQTTQMSEDRSRMKLRLSDISFYHTVHIPGFYIVRGRREHALCMTPRFNLLGIALLSDSLSVLAHDRHGHKLQKPVSDKMTVPLTVNLILMRKSTLTRIGREPLSVLLKPVAEKIRKAGDKWYAMVWDPMAAGKVGRAKATQATKQKVHPNSNSARTSNPRQNVDDIRRLFQNPSGKVGMQELAKAHISSSS
ncbi:hypothetical protein BGZ63DRAFT_443679 [Mariannaea sp. PMI_226]|nr:hypothetical protein BGZ63DRAFT_443679 [Mariannaea sp. PMI_226]